MKPASNPTRRNRNIGTSASGHGQDNELCIPSSWHELVFWEQMPNRREIVREVAGSPVSFFVQPTLDGFIHACTPDDLTTLMNMLPAADVHGLGAVLLRQPTRKQKILAPVWGRLAHCVEVGAYHGPAIVLEACNPSVPIKWPKRLRPDERKELDRLTADGHQISVTKREYIISVTPESLRTGVLYRTVLHEIGHWADWRRSVEIPAQEDKSKEEDELDAVYWARPQRQREDAAHRYAQEQANALRASNAIPFPSRGLDAATLESANLSARFFGHGKP